MKKDFQKHPWIVIFSVLMLLLLFSPGIYGQKKPVSDAKTVALDQTVPIDPKITVGKLDNGLKYYIRENHKPENRAELRLVVNAGSVLEDEDQLGLAHFVEHMAFNGTEHFKKHELVDFMESIGMQFGPEINAYTIFDETVYMLTIPLDSEEIIEKTFQIFEDWAHAISFEDEEIDKERGVIIEEWRLGQGAGARIRDKQFPVLLKGSRYSERLPIGKKEILENFEYETIKRFYKDWYRPDLMAFIAVGDFDKSQIESLIKKYFDNIPSPVNPRERKFFEIPDHEGTLFSIATDKEATGAGVTVYYKQPLRDQSTVGAYRQGIVETLFNNMLNYRFYELTQVSTPPFIGASSSQNIMLRTKEAYTLSASVEDKGILPGLETILAEAERVKKHGFTASELERQKSDILRYMETAYNERDKSNSNSFAGEYSRNFLQDEPIPGIAYEFELFKRFIPEISLEEVNRLAEEWIIERNRVVLVVAPEKEDLTIPSEKELREIFEIVKNKDIIPYEDKTTDEPLVKNVPEPVEIIEEKTIDEVGITEWTLANGIKIVLKPTDFKEDQVLFRAFSPGGTSLAENEDFISASTASFIISSGGLGSFNAIELQKKLAGKIVNVSPLFSELEEGIAGSASPKDIETMFQLIYLTFTQPRADTIVFNSLYTRLNAILKNRSANPAAAFQDTLQSALTQYHFRSRPMTPEILNEMHLEKSFRFYKERFEDAGDFIFVFVGNIDPDVIRPLVKRYLGGLPSINREETWKDIGIDYPKGIIDKKVYKGIDQKSQTALIFTGVIEYNRENVFALNSLTELLQIKLREKLREDLGGTYGVNINSSASRIPDQEYLMAISFGSDPERVEELTESIFSEIQDVKSSGVSADYITKVKEAQKRNWETNLKKNEFWLSQLAARYKWKQDPENILTYENMFDTINPDLIMNAAKKYINTDNYIKVSLFPEDKK
ncbi:M16 family metallopeptidase [candidate division KSB1 bacterium]